MSRFIHSRQKRQAARRLCFMAVLTILGLGSAAFVGYSQQPSPPPAGSAGGVHGHVFVRVGGQMTTRPFEAATGHFLFLPDFEVFLRNVATGELSQPVKTNLLGRFMFPLQKAGTYELRWKQQAGWQEGVFDKKVVIANGTAYAGLVEIKPQQDGGLLVGQVKRADGTSPSFHDEFFGVTSATQVEALDGKGNKVAGPVQANAAGEFAIAGLPKASLQVRATDEAAVATQDVPVSSLSFGLPASPVALMFSRHLPRIASIAAAIGQKTVRYVAPGATVTVTADVQNIDQSALKFDWRLPEGMGLLKSAGTSADWTLPGASGPCTAYVMVSDGFGGYATSSVSVLVGMTEEASAGQSPAGSGAPAGSSTILPSSAPGMKTAAQLGPLDPPPPATACLNVVVASTFPPGTTLTVNGIASGALNQSVIRLSGLPPNTDLTLGVSDSSLGVTFETGPLSPLPDNIVHTGAAGDCQAVRLTQFPVPTSTSFLNFFEGTPEPDIANAYYAAVDPPDPANGFPNGRRTTLGAWWKQNGFDPGNGTAVGEVRASYLNNNDLGSGRDMHFLRHGDGTVSAYVTNYLDGTDFSQNPTYADSAAAQDPRRRQAAVCMEWSPVEGSNIGSIVKFFVYSPVGGANAIRITHLNLDGHGEKYVPHLCVICHGGTPPISTQISSPDLQARFREFDLATFKFPGGREVPNDTERAAFKQLNLIVRGNSGDNISAPGIKELVNGWYGIDNTTFIDPHPTFTGQNTSFTPLGWVDQSPPATAFQSTSYLYHSVVAKSCRTCHVAFGNLHDPAFGLDWTTFTQFKNNSAASFVSPGSMPQMPHAQVTYKNFWNSRNPSEVGVLEKFFP